MTQDARRALAFVAKRQATDTLPVATWANVLSLELGWFTPGDARRFIDACIAAGLLRTTDDGAALGFPCREVELPRGFRPGPDAFPDAADATPTTVDPFRDLVDRIATHGNGTRAEVLERIAQVQDRFGGTLHANAAAVRVAIDEGLDVQDTAARMLERLTGNAGSPDR